MALLKAFNIINTSLELGFYLLLRLCILKGLSLQFKEIALW